MPVYHSGGLSKTLVYSWLSKRGRLCVGFSSGSGLSLSCSFKSECRVLDCSLLVVFAVHSKIKSCCELNFDYGYRSRGATKQNGFIAAEGTN